MWGRCPRSQRSAPCMVFSGRRRASSVPDAFNAFFSETDAGNVQLHQPLMCSSTQSVTRCSLDSKMSGLESSCNCTAQYSVLCQRCQSTISIGTDLAEGTLLSSTSPANSLSMPSGITERRGSNSHSDWQTAEMEPFSSQVCVEPHHCVS